MGQQRPPWIAYTSLSTGSHCMASSPILVTGPHLRLVPSISLMIVLQFGSRTWNGEYHRGGRLLDTLSERQIMHLNISPLEERPKEQVLPSKPCN